VTKRFSVDEMAMFVGLYIANLFSCKPDEDNPGKPHLYFAGNFKTSVSDANYFVDLLNVLLTVHHSISV
jgi:hypothetical protein